jgi:hypothetical protein
MNNVEGNHSFKNVTASSTKDLISILFQNENKTVIIMPCDGSVIDEAGNVYRLKGPFELKCGDFVTFNYTTACYAGQATDMVVSRVLLIGPIKMGIRWLKKVISEHVDYSIFGVDLCIDVTQFLCIFNYVNGMNQNRSSRLMIFV